MQVEELNSKLADVETGINRQQYEASEVKVSQPARVDIHVHVAVS